MMDEITNKDRAERGVKLIESYASGNNLDEADPTDISDILADLKHFCHLNAVDFDYCLSSAQMHFEEELEEEFM